MCKAAEKLFRQDVRHIVCVNSECENWQKKGAANKVWNAKKYSRGSTIFGYCKNNMQRTKATVFALWRLRPTPCFHFFCCSTQSIILSFALDIAAPIQSTTYLNNSIFFSISCQQ